LTFQVEGQVAAPREPGQELAGGPGPEIRLDQDFLEGLKIVDHPFLFGTEKAGPPLFQLIPGFTQSIPEAHAKKVIGQREKSKGVH
jgi:hypothetical protein